MGNKEEAEDDERQEALDAVVNLQRIVWAREKDFNRAVVTAHDDHGWTFRELGEALDMAHSNVFKHYERGKLKGGRK